MWRELVEEYDGVELRDAADEDVLDAAEVRIGHPLPGDLRDLLAEGDGMSDEYGSDIVWSTDQIVSQNIDIRTNPAFRDLYMSFDDLIFFGDNGGGDQFAFTRFPNRRDVFVWDHETDSRLWISASLEDFIRRTLGADGEDWYRTD